MTPSELQAIREREKQTRGANFGFTQAHSDRRSLLSHIDALEGLDIDTDLSLFCGEHDILKMIRGKIVQLGLETK